MKLILAFLLSTLSIVVSASIEEDYKKIITYTVSPELAEKEFGISEVKFFDSGLTAYSLIELKGDTYHVVGIPSKMAFINNKYITSFMLHDTGHLSGKAISSSVAEKWVFKSLNGFFEHEIASNNGQVTVYIRTDYPIEKYLNPTSNFADE